MKQSTCSNLYLMYNEANKAFIKNSLVINPTVVFHKKGSTVLARMFDKYVDTTRMVFQVGGNIIYFTT